LTRRERELTRFSRWEPPVIKEGEPTIYNWIVRWKSGFELGHQTDIGAFTYINAKMGVVLEDHVQIGSHCAVYSISTVDNKSGRVVLKRNCKIGSHSVIMPGVTIGRNSIVGAFSFVNRDIPDGVLAYGVPVQIIRDLTVDEMADG
jgi:acetyltransferase-like isoleucine patch superfamily enzyme